MLLCMYVRYRNAMRKCNMSCGRDIAACVHSIYQINEEYCTSMESSVEKQQ